MGTQRSAPKCRYRSSEEDVSRQADRMDQAPQMANVAADGASRLSSLKRRRRVLDLVWIVGLLISPGPLLITVDSNYVVWWMGISVILVVVGLVGRSRMTRAIWMADPASAPPGWQRTWLMDLERKRAE